MADTKLRILQIEAELAEMKRRFFVDRVEGDMRRRVTLEAEFAQLAIQRHEERMEEAAQKALALEAKAKSFQAILCKKVEDAGLVHLIREAQDESLAFIKDAGLHEAYSSRVRT